ncbi:MAG: hypothetical protein WB706_11350 [Nitrososphaeraceae archaeon]
MLNEKQIQTIEKTLNIERETRPGGKCVFGLYQQGEGCGRPAVNWLPNIAADVDGGRPELLNVCKFHADLFGLE